jgi:hypothetical protein
VGGATEKALTRARRLSAAAGLLSAGTGGRSAW